MTRDEYLKADRWKRLGYAISRHPITVFGGYLTVFLYGMTIRSFFLHPKKHFDAGVAVVLHVALLTFCWMQGWDILLLGMLVPLTVACGLGAYLFYAQHNFPNVHFADRAGWTYNDAALESSSFMVTGRLMAWFSANIGYHHIHHLNARIPFYSLPEVFRDLPELQTPRVTSLHPAEILRCLRLKVWDTEAQRMVSLHSMASEPAAQAT